MSGLLAQRRAQRSGRHTVRKADERGDKVSLGFAASLVVTSVLVGAIAGLAASSSAPLLALVFPLVLIPLALWWRPVLGLYAVFFCAVAIEQFPYAVDAVDFNTGYSDTVARPSLTSTIPVFHGILPAKASPVEAVLLVVATFLLLQAVRRRARFSLDTPISRLLAGLLGLVVGYFMLGLLTGGSFRWALWEMRPFMYLGLSYLLARNLLTDPKTVRPLLWIIVVGSTYKAFDGFTIWWSIHASPNRPEAVLAHEESFFFGLYIVATLGMWLFGVKGLLRRVATLFLPIVLLCDMVNSRRTAWFIIFFAIAVMLVVAAVAVPRQRKRIIAVGLVAALAAMVYLPVFWSKNGTLAQPARAVRSVIAPDARDEASNDYRKAESFNLTMYIKGSHSTGMGFGKRLVYQGMYDLTGGGTKLLAYVPHNGILYIWLRLGIVGMVTLCLLLSQAVIRAARLARSATDPLAGLLGAVTAAVIFGYAVMGAVDMGFSWFRNAIAIGLLVGAVDGQLRSRETQPSAIAEGAAETAVARGELVAR